MGQLEERTGGRYEVAFRPDKLLESEVRVCDGFILFGATLGDGGYWVDTRVCSMHPLEIEAVIEHRDRLELSLGPLIARKMHITVTDNETGETREDAYNGFLFFSASSDGNETEFRSVCWRLVEDDIDQCMDGLSEIVEKMEGRG